MQAQLTLQQYAFASLTCITFQAYFYTNIQGTFKKHSTCKQTLYFLGVGLGLPSPGKPT